MARSKQTKLYNNWVWNSNFLYSFLDNKQKEEEVEIINWIDIYIWRRYHCKYVHFIRRKCVNRERKKNNNIAVNGLAHGKPFKRFLTPSVVGTSWRNQHRSSHATHKHTHTHKQTQKQHKITFTTKSSILHGTRHRNTRKEHVHSRLCLVYKSCAATSEHWGCSHWNVDPNQSSRASPKKYAKKSKRRN